MHFSFHFPSIHWLHDYLCTHSPTSTWQYITNATIMSYLSLPPCHLQISEEPPSVSPYGKSSQGRVQVHSYKERHNDGDNDKSNLHVWSHITPQFHSSHISFHIYFHTFLSVFLFIPPHLYCLDNSVKFIFINVLSQKPDSQLQKQHNIETQITKDNKEDTHETNKANNRIHTSLITQFTTDIISEYDNGLFQYILITTYRQKTGLQLKLKHRLAKSNLVTKHIYVSA